MGPSAIEDADRATGTTRGARASRVDGIGWLLGHRSVLLGALIVSVIVAAALLAPVLPIGDPNRTQPGRRLAAPCLRASSWVRTISDATS